MNSSPKSKENTNVPLLGTKMNGEDNSLPKKEEIDGMIIELDTIVREPNPKILHRDSKENLEGAGFCQWADLIGAIVTKHGKHVINLVLFVGYIVYMVFAVRFDPEGSVFVCVLCSLLILHRIIRTLHIDLPKLILKVYDKIRQCLPENVRQSKAPRIVITSAVSIALVIFLVMDVWSEPQRLMSLVGLVVFIVFLFITSKAPRKIKWTPVIWGLLLQFALGLFILRWPTGYSVCVFMGDQIRVLLSYTDAGSKFIFGEKTYTLHPVAFKIVPTIIFFGSMISVLYYLHAMQKLIKWIAVIFKILMQTTSIESFGTAAHIFVGQIQSSLALRPFLYEMTNSELHALMTSGFATVAGSIVAAYVEFGVPAEHVISASFMSAPASLAVAKLGWPETEETIEVDTDIELHDGGEKNILEAASVGAASSVKHIAYVIVNIIAFLAFLAFFDAVVTYLGARVGYPDISFALICSYVFMPLAVVMGVPSQDAKKIGVLIGKKLFTNELLAYADLGAMKKSGEIEGRTLVLGTYILCGFGSISAMGVVMGAMTAVEPRIRSRVSGGIVRSLIAGNIACFMTACIAAILYQENDDTANRLNTKTTMNNDTVWVNAAYET
ncbi:hypothetical protein KUTeg_009523, partial [Tegillarca granosa]